MNESHIKDIEDSVSSQRKITEQMKSLSESLKHAENSDEEKMIGESIDSLKNSLKKHSKKTADSVKKISMYKPLNQYQIGQNQTSQIKPQAQTSISYPVQTTPQQTTKKDMKKKFELDELEKMTLKRAKKKEKKSVKVKERKPNKYIQISSRFFNKTSLGLIKKGKFRLIQRELIKANLEFISVNYLSFMFFTTLVSLIASVFIMLFFLFFSFIATPPFIVTAADTIGIRLLKVFWIIFLLPAAVFMFLYFYPTMERKSLEGKIDQELPFATIHMSSISSSMIEPSKIFVIIIQTNEYPHLSKEFTKLLNKINIYGHDLVTALRESAFNSPSKKLAELFNGLATTTTSGGNLPDFFDKRSQTLLFDYRIDREKQSKAAETFMDIYISVVIAAPMILMLLLVMMRISGLGLSLSTGMITIIMVLAVSVINILFLTFLHLKSPD